MHWAFSVPRGQLRKYWKQIPSGLDILITHGPPYGILGSEGSKPRGDEELLAALQRVKPRVRVFGHIHSGYRTMQNLHTVFFNASPCNEDYEPIREPWVIALVVGD